MKKLLAILLLSIASILPQNMSGTGSYADPYLLYDANDVDSLRLFMDTYGTGTTNYVEIQNDIDFAGKTFLDGSSLWFPIFKTATDTMIFDGNGYTLSNLTIRWDNSTHSITGEVCESAGLFSKWGTLTNDMDTIRNLYLYNVDVIMDSSVTTYTGTVSDRIGAAALIGVVYGSGSGNAVSLVNIFVRNAYIRLVTQGTAWIPSYMSTGFVVGIVYSAQCDLYRVGVDSSTAFAYFSRINSSGGIGGLVGEMYSAVSTWNETFVSNSNVYLDVAPAYYEFAGVTGTSSMLGRYNGTAWSLNNSYVYKGILKPNGTLGGNSDPNVAGALYGEINANLDNCYVASVTYDRYFAAAENDELGWVGGYAGHALGGATSIIDTTGLSATNWYGLYGQNSTVYPAVGDSLVLGNPTSMANNASTFNSLGWDMVGTWDVDATINDGYPYLLWAREYLLSGFINLNYPDAAGLTFREDSIITAHWAISPGAATEQYLSYSIDAGSSWIPLDTIANVIDTSYIWTIPANIYSSQGLFRVTTNVSSIKDSSANFFTILPYSTIEFLYPIEVANQTFFVGDTAHIELRSIFVDNFLLYWSHDSLGVYTFLDSVAVDTTNNAHWDSTTYVWTFDAGISGPDIWLKATEFGDTTLYGWEETVVDLNQGYPVNLFLCQYDDGGNMLEHNFRWDPSCAWASPPITWYTRLLPDDGLGPAWTWLSEIFPWPYTGADHPEPDPIYIVTPPDTNTRTITQFYGDAAATVTYQGRTYFVSTLDSTLRCNDNINSIDSLFVADLKTSIVYTTGLAGGGTWTPGTEILQVYHVQFSKVQNAYTQYDADFEALNDSWFTPKIVIGSTSSPRRVVTVSALPYPIDPNFAETIQLAYVDATIGRFYFRGIHPKAEKR